MRLNTWRVLVSIVMITCGFSIAYAQGETAPVVRSVEVQGFQHVGPVAQQQVYDVINPLIGQPVNVDNLKKAVADIEALGSFSTAAVEQVPVENGMKLVVKVEENPILQAIEISGNKSLTEEQIRAIINLKPGEVLNQRQVVRDAIAIEDVFADAKHGFTLSKVIQTPLREGSMPGQVILSFVILEPTIDEIKIAGNKRTFSFVILREINREIKVGDIYNVRKITQAQINLSQLGIFDDVRPSPEPGTRVGTVSLTFTIHERRTGTAAVGVAQNSVAGWTGFINVTDTNLIGTGQRLSLDLRVGAETSYQVAYMNPWIDKKRTSLNVDVYSRSILREAFLGVQDTTIDYEEQRTGLSMTLGRPLNDTTRLFLGFRVDNFNGSNVKTSSNLVIPPDIVDAITKRSNIRSVSLTMVHDTRNDLMKPYHGIYSSVGGEMAAFGSSDNFAKFTAELRWFAIVKKDKHAEEKALMQKAPSHWVYASRLMAGTSSGLPPFLDQFLLGGADTLRGYKEDRFPGGNMVLWNHELRVPITGELDLVPFIDLGDAWGGRFADFFGDPSFTLHYGYGAGIRLQTPIGPLRLDYGINDKGNNQFTFGVGATF